MKSKLTFGRARTRGARDAAGNLPKRIKVLDWGENHNYNDEPIIVNSRFLKIFGLAAYPYKEVDIDFAHNTVPGTDAYNSSSEPRPVAARCEVEIVEGDGVYVNVLRYTPEGETNADNYAEVSPTPIVDPATNEVLMMSGVGLVRHGASMNTKEFAQVTMGADMEAALEKILTNNNDGNGSRDVRPPINNKNMTRAEMLAALGLAADDAITDDALKTKLTEALKSVKVLEDKVAKLEGAAKGDGAVAPADGTTKPMSLEIKALQDKIAALEEKQTTDRKTALLEEARKNGKVIPLSAADLSSLTEEQIKGICERALKVVPLSAKTPGVVREVADGDQPTEMEKTIAANCGVKLPEKKEGK